MPTKIQLKPVKTVEIEPESAVQLTLSRPPTPSSWPPLFTWLMPRLKNVVAPCLNHHTPRASFSTVTNDDDAPRASGSAASSKSASGT